MMPKVLLEDEFKFQQTPFIVKAQVEERYIDGNTGKSRGVNMYGAPTGMKKTPSKSWVVCKAVHVKVRPDYPYSERKEWPENVDKHFQTTVPLEEPVKSRGLIFSKWTAEKKRDVEDIDIQAVADKTIEKLKTAYEERDKVQSLNSTV